MRPSPLASLVVALGLLASVDARAAEPPSTFGRRHDVVISGERLVGFAHTWQRATVGDSFQETTTNAFTFLGASSAPETLYSTPRLAADVFVIDRLSLGGSLAYARASVVGSGANAPTTTQSRFLLAVRVGYALPLGRVVSLWPRLGATHVRTTAPAFAGGRYTALTLELPVTFAVSPHVLVSVGPTLDLGLNGAPDGFVTDSRFRQTELGVQAGLSAAF
jgi:hypothetical protein